jgi:hypothetical protein
MGSDVLGSLTSAHPQEFFSFNVNAGAPIAMEVSSSVPAPEPTELLLYDQDGNLVAIAAGSASDGSSSIINFTVPGGGAGTWTAAVASPATTCITTTSDSVLPSAIRLTFLAPSPTPLIPATTPSRRMRAINSICWPLPQILPINPTSCCCMTRTEILSRSRLRMHRMACRRSSILRSLRAGRAMDRRSHREWFAEQSFLLRLANPRHHRLRASISFVNPDARAFLHRSAGLRCGRPRMVRAPSKRFSEENLTHNDIRL